MVANANLCLKIQPVDLLHYCLSTCSEKVIVKLCFVVSSRVWDRRMSLRLSVSGTLGEEIAQMKVTQTGEDSFHTRVFFFFFFPSPFFQILFCIFNWTSVKSLSKKPINYPSKFSPCLTVANDLCVTSGQMRPQALNYRRLSLFNCSK